MNTLPVTDHSLDYAAPEELFETGERTGLEAELSSAEYPSDIARPFDPEKIKVLRETKTISLLATRIDHKEIDLAPEFQRLARIWDIGRKSRLIESVLLRIPLPVFYVASDFEDAWSVVDGLQRLTTIHDFMKDKYRLKGLEYLTQFTDLTFSSLPRNMQRRIEETELVVNVIQPGTPEEVMFNIFSRINTGGLTLNGQEIRHALNKGPARRFLKDLAESPAFLRATARSISDKRMAARECALRFLAFWMTPWHDYETSDLDGFLNAAMQRLNSLTPIELTGCKESYERAMRAAFEIFGVDSFRKRYTPMAPRNPISKALFETWSVSLARLSVRELNHVISSRDLVKDRFMNLMMTDRDFDVSISYSTGSPSRVHKRFHEIEMLLKEIA